VIHHTLEVITSNISLPQGKGVLSFEFLAAKAEKQSQNKPTGGTGRLLINGEEAGQARLSPQGGGGWSQALGIGRSFGFAMSSAFQSQFPFSGT
jgi:hypothetical protein